jgi:hypothetical protein
VIDPKIVEQIIQTWNDDQNHPNRRRDQRVLPPADVIKEFVEAAYFASSKLEKGRSLRFSAVLVPKTEATSLPIYDGSIHVFEAPIPFTASSIPKIAPAFDPQLSSLAVESNDQGELLIWGVFSFASPKHRYNEIPVGVMGTPSMQPDFLTVSAVASGSLLFSRCDSALGRIAEADFVPASPTPFTPYSLGKYWWDFLTRTASWSTGGWYWHCARDALEVFLKEVARRGHGGTVVVLDSSAPLPSSQLYTPNHVFKAYQNVAEFLVRCIPTENISSDLTIDIAYRKIMLEALQRLAQLAAIDGALIIDSTFKVVAFGAKLTAPAWDKKTVIGPDGYGNPNGESFEITRYGTRHQSARDFAGAFQSAIVFVISQDGPIRAFHRIDAETVTVWPDCTTSMFV